MPEMDGPTLLKELRRRDPQVKIIFVSGYAEEAFAKNLPSDDKARAIRVPGQALHAQATGRRGETDHGGLTQRIRYIFPVNASTITTISNTPTMPDGP